MNVAIVKYNAGNVASVSNALCRLGVEPVVTDSAELLSQADKVIFPGVGEASTAMRYLRERQLDVVIKSLVQPLLGICLGLQLLCSRSDENDTTCLGVFPNVVRRFSAAEHKVPHVGWNTVRQLSSSSLFRGVDEDSHFYFVHGYWAAISEDTAAVCEYGESFSAALACGNYYATQFHPEKSGAVGEKVLANFLDL